MTCGGRRRAGSRWIIAGFDPVHAGVLAAAAWRGPIARTGSATRSRKVIGETGVLSGRRRRAVDSTILADAVATQDTITQLVSAIRRVAREVPGAAEQIAAVCTGHDYRGRQAEDRLG